MVLRIEKLPCQSGRTCPHQDCPDNFTGFYKRYVKRNPKVKRDRDRGMRKALRLYIVRRRWRLLRCDIMNWTHPDYDPHSDRGWRARDYWLF